jgi:hypothetical protein
MDGGLQGTYHTLTYAPIYCHLSKKGHHAAALAPSPQQQEKHKAKIASAYLRHCFLPFVPNLKHELQQWLQPWKDLFKQESPRALLHKKDDLKLTIHKKQL